MWPGLGANEFHQIVIMVGPLLLLKGNMEHNVVPSQLSDICKPQVQTAKARQFVLRLHCVLFQNEILTRRRPDWPAAEFYSPPPKKKEVEKVI